MPGWISLHRQIVNNWVWKSKPFSYGQAWIDILLECNHQENKVLIKGKLISVKRGESINSLKTWALRFGWSISKVRHFLDLLRKDGMLRLESERVTTRLIVCNYETYQDVQHAKGTQKVFRKFSESFQKDLNNNDNNDNNENKKHKHGVYKNVLLKDKEIEKLKEKFGDKYTDQIEMLSEGLELKGYTYKSHYLAILKWSKNSKIDIERKSEIKLSHNDVLILFNGKYPIPPDKDIWDKVKSIKENDKTYWVYK